MIKRATPVQTRKALEVAHLYAKMGINFVAMPVLSDEEGAALADQAIAKLEEIARAADQVEVPGQQGEAKP